MSCSDDLTNYINNIQKSLNDMYKKNIPDPIQNCPKKIEDDLINMINKKLQSLGQNPKLQSTNLTINNNEDSFYIIVLRKKCDKSAYVDSELNKQRLSLNIGDQDDFPEWMDDLYKHYIIRIKQKHLNNYLFDLRGTPDNPGLYPNSEIILNFKDPNSISLVSILGNEPIVKKSIFNHFCITDESEIIKFIVNYNKTL